MSSVSEILQGAFDGLPPQTDLRIGDEVRSYDFPGKLTCYVDGVIEEFTPPMEGCPRYRIRVTRRVFNDEVVTPEAPYVFPPLNGTPTWTGSFTNSVVKLKLQ